MHVEWVNPLTIPLQRRLQTCMVLFYMSMFMIFPMMGFALMIFLMFTPLFFLPVAYLTWMLVDIYVWQTGERGGRPWRWLRCHSAWKYMRDFFPVILVKSADLDPKKNYVLGYHPHGILGCGAFCNFATEANGIKEVFPGVNIHLLTLKDNFKLPFAREFIMWMGVCSVSKSSISYIVQKMGPGHSVLIVIGGAEESLEAHPGTYRLTLKNRKGFVKIALKNGSSLVPVYSFGENDLYFQADNPEGSFIRKFQEKFKNLFGFAPPFFYGRGIFNYTFGLLPYRKPIVTVVGNPIDVPLDANPDQEVIDKYHTLYMEELERLFNKFKVTYGIDENKMLEFI